MKHRCYTCFKILLGLLIASLVGLFFLIRYLECNPIFMGGGPSYRPERCTAKERAESEKLKKEYKMDVMQQLAALEFSCVHEERPPIPKEAQQLYNYALYQDLHKMWTGKAGDWNELLPYYRIAAANGDYKANVRLQYLLETNRALTSKSYDEVHNLNKLLAKSLPATAYYKLYGHLDIGFGVTTKEKDGKYAYLRKAADLGSREAQYVVADMLGDIDDPETLEYRLKIIEQLRLCASEQGLADASEFLGIGYQDEGQYNQALQAYHQGVKNGSSMSALTLSYGFDGKRKDDGTDNDFLNLPKDLERSIRYKMIWDYLFDHDYLQPKVPDLDEIVPLPPAKLPPWDGKIAFQRWFEGPSPQKPSDELMQQLAEKAGLDWQTGLPLKK
ncbi:sel1 repeat family protein [Avibacterium avium]|uniref:SEL1-like repeat protein n=1 Tax=Avibacterium avium TaxID=751 RepID=UPI003BF7AD3C